MTINFAKMHGCGNDFVVIDATDDFASWTPSSEQAAYLLDRHFGIGGDQLLILYPSEIADARMAIYNCDGGEVEMCGNGIRCCALYMVNRKLTEKTEFEIETLAGIIKPVVEGRFVRVDMGRPVLEAENIPVNGFSGQVIEAEPPETVGCFPLPKMSCVSMGNPHAIFFVDDINSVPLAKIGPKVEKNEKIFPASTNVEFAQAISRSEVRMRVWERGSGITLACGTGACGTVVAGILSDRLNDSVTVTLDGGELTISWPDINGNVFMTGPAVEVFNGSIEI